MPHDRSMELLRQLIPDRALEKAVRLRQIKKMSLGDSLIAGTALVHDLTLVTRNTDDFAWIASLNLLNPLEPPTSSHDEASQ